ncbi:MAG: amidohydrolase [Acidobacteria bacterium]|nr:amidohydrolase [Acidobacteriota bacterium]
MRWTAVSACALVVGLTGCSSQPPVEPASLVLRGGTVVTMEASQPTVEAVAIRGDRIVALGPAEDIQRYVGPSTEVIDLAGQTAIPGFIEGHGHFMGVGQARMVLDLMDTTSFEQIVAQVAEAVKTAKPGEWILGRGWHQEKWTTTPSPNVEGFPYHDALSKVSPDNPVLLEHASGHAAFANAKAMELAGVTARTPSPPGGDILKDRSGRPIGVFRERAAGLVDQALGAWRSAKTPAERMADARRQIELATEEAFSKGVTSFQDAGVNFDTVALYKQVAGEGQLGIRLWVMVRDTNEHLREHLAAEKVVGMADHHLTVAAIKVTADGALGSRGAWMLEPYTDSPGSTGLNTTPIANIEEAAAIAMDTGTQLGIHAIGDRANREVLNVYEAAFKAHPDQSDLRWRIEHAQHLSASDIPRFGQLGVIASMQGIHCTSDAPYVLARLGPARAEEGAYVWQKLMKSGAIISNGTDTPVERIDPIANYYATVTRKAKDGSVFYGDQKMSREEALKSYTWNAAYAAKEDTLKGSLAIGKLADIAVLSQNILTVPDEALPETKVTRTIVGGKVVFGGIGN